MNEKILINALVQKAREINDPHLSNEKLAKMLIDKNVSFENKEKINEILEFLKAAKEGALMSKRD